jgi:hypothetical protein
MTITAIVLAIFLALSMAINLVLAVVLLGNSKLLDDTIKILKEMNEFHKSSNTFYHNALDKIVDHLKSIVGRE